MKELGLGKYEVSFNILH